MIALLASLCAFGHVLERLTNRSQRAPVTYDLCRLRRKGLTSHHLQQLLRAGLVRTRRDGNRVYYALTSNRVGDLWAAVRDVAAAHCPNWTV